MPSSRCHLTIKAPSPCAIEYTVSTAFRPETIRSYILQYFTILIRVLVGISVCLALLEKLEILPTALFYRYDLVKDIAWSRFGPAAAVVLFLVLRRWHTGK